MLNNKKVLGIIPARLGSKGLTRKNLKLLCGKPLIAHSIEAGLKSNFIDKLIVSTESEEIANESLKYGNLVPFLRPSKLAQDNTPIADVIKFTLEHYRDTLDETFDYVVLIEPTSPLRDSNDIDKAIQNLVENTDAKSIVGICETKSINPNFLFEMNENNFLIKWDDENDQPLQRQDIKKVFFIEGSIYISDVNYFLLNNTFYHEKTIGFEIPKWKSIEIDDFVDFSIAEYLMENRDKFESSK